MQPEEQLIAAQRGKWSEAGVPHRGWICVDIEDLGDRAKLAEFDHITRLLSARTRNNLPLRIR
jgi:hypothetical protein